MLPLKKVSCNFCKKNFYKNAGHVNENLKLGHNFYCSNTCESKNKSKQKLLICENEECNKKFFRSPRAISLHNFCSRSCAVKINNRKNPKRKAKKAECPICNQVFKVGSRIKFCSFECRRKGMTRYSPDELLKMIKIAATELKRVPAKRELKEVAESSIKVFGSWNAAIVAAGLNPNRSHDNRMYKRTRTEAEDGHLCDSASEAVVDNWLAKNRISHERDVVYPRSFHKADWGIKNNKIFIEYFGLAKDSPRYDRSIKKKKRLCQEAKIALIEIYPKDLYPDNRLDSKLKVLLQ